jgi:hypothetical protein
MDMADDIAHRIDRSLQQAGLESQVLTSVSAAQRIHLVIAAEAWRNVPFEDRRAQVAPLLQSALTPEQRQRVSIQILLDDEEGEEFLQEVLDQIPPEALEPVPPEERGGIVREIISQAGTLTT